MDKQRSQIIGAMKSVSQQFAELAPPPAQAGHKGPVFVKANPEIPASDDREAMLGSLLMECVLGSCIGEAFADAASASQTPEFIQDTDWNNVIEVADEYWTDRRNSNGSYRLGERGSVNGNFNAQARGPITTETEKRMTAYMNDMGTRQKLEAQYATLSKEFSDMKQDDFENWERALKPETHQYSAPQFMPHI